MAVWRADDNQDPGFHLVQNGFVTKFRSAHVIDEVISSFRGAGYRIIGLDAGLWADEGAMHNALSNALRFPGYYGRNLDALADCLLDVAELNYGWSEADTGLIIVLDNFDHLHSSMPSIAVTLLDTISHAASYGALLGNRLLCLIRSDDPRLEVGCVGGYEPQWNAREWLASDRGQ